MEATDSIAKPWLLVQLRLKKLQERQSQIPQEVYVEELEDIFQDMMNLGEWWHGMEDEVFWLVDSQNNQELAVGCTFEGCCTRDRTSS